MRRRDAPVLLAFAALVAGCAGPIGLAGVTGGRPVFREPGMTVAQAAKAIVPGRDDRSSVEQRLGPAEQLRFASGYEVWVWRDPDWRRRQAPGPELLVLFDPGGRVSKVRSAGGG